MRSFDAARSSDPLVEVARADRQAVAVDQRRHAHRRLAAVGEAVEADARAVDEGGWASQSSVRSCWARMKENSDSFSGLRLALQDTRKRPRPM